MTCNASKFRSPTHLAKLAISGALSSQVPTFHGLRISKRVESRIRRGSKIRVRVGALVEYRNATVPYKNRAPVTVEYIRSADEILIACTSRGATSPSKAFGAGLVDAAFTTDHMSLMFQRCGILLPGMPACGSELIQASSPRWMVSHLSDWLTMEQIEILVRANRIQYLRREGRVEIYLVAPGRVGWVGEKGYWREVSMEDVALVA